MMWRATQSQRAARAPQPVQQSQGQALCNLQGMGTVVPMEALSMLLESVMQYDGRGNPIIPGTEMMGKRIDVLTASEWREQQLAQVREGTAAEG
ncbi:MAG TPA: hypothetical protein VHP11_14490 [Tepidisphaeraceae bacterium]|nr:hypothetical protein [Tepidisphaeraceae bacterium]